MRHEIPPVVKRKKVRNARPNCLITGGQILTIAVSFFCPKKHMRPDVQPDNSHDGAGAPEMHAESESSAATVLPADSITTFIQAIDGEADEIWEEEIAQAQLSQSRLAAIVEETPNFVGIADEEEIVQAQLSQSRLAAIVEETPDFVGIADIEGRLLFVNAAGRKIIGLEPAESLASMKILDCHPDWARRIISQEGIPTALQNGFWSGETAAICQDGVDIPVSQVIIAHRNSLGRVEYLSTILRDITDRKHAELIQVRLRRQAALRSVVNFELSAREVPLDEVLRRCSEAMIWHLDVALARIWLHNSEDRTLDPVASAGTPVNAEEPEESEGSEGRTEREPPASGTANGFGASWVAKTMRPYLTNDPLNDQEIAGQGSLREWLQIERITAFAAFPMIAGDTLVGVLAVFSRHTLEDDTVGELTSLAGLIALGVERRKIDEESLQIGRASC